MPAFGPKQTTRYELWDSKVSGFGIRVTDAKDLCRPGKFFKDVEDELQATKNLTKNHVRAAVTKVLSRGK